MCPRAKDSVAACRDSNAAGEGGAVEVTRACDLQDIATDRKPWRNQVSSTACEEFDKMHSPLTCHSDLSRGYCRTASTSPGRTCCCGCGKACASCRTRSGSCSRCLLSLLGCYASSCQKMLVYPHFLDASLDRILMISSVQHVDLNKP